VAAVVIRIVLVPLGYGDDFLAWDIASRATLNGSNIYAQHPSGYPTGPFAYPPLFLYLELPFQFLAIRLGLSFVILGKIPIVLADLVCGWLIVKHFRDRAASDRAAALHAALFLLNPLVLYNSAFYGRFDSVCLAFLLLALRLHGLASRGGNAFPVAYAAAIATKIFPAFMLPWFWWNEPRRRWKTFGVIAATLVLVCLPYLLKSARPLVDDTVLVNINQYARGLSWQVVFRDQLPLQILLALSYVCLATFLIVANIWVDCDLYQYALRILLVFTLLSKVVYEQYLVWVIPFAIFGLARRTAATTALLLTLTTIGMIANSHVHPFGGDVIPINLLLASAIALFLWTDWRVRDEGHAIPVTT
jgi:hypothetical protein